MRPISIYLYLFGYKMNNILNLIERCNTFYKLAENNVFSKPIPGAASDPNHPLHREYLDKWKEYQREKLEALYEDPIAWEAYRAKRREQDNTSLKARLEKNKEVELEKLRKHNLQEAQTARQLRQSNSLEGLMFRLKTTLANITLDFKRRHKNYVLTNKLDEGYKDPKWEKYKAILNGPLYSVREGINEYLGNYIDGKYVFTKQNLEKTIRLCNDSISHLGSLFRPESKIILIMHEILDMLTSLLDTLNKRSSKTYKDQFIICN
jgi:hypothetical protein